MSIAGGRDGEAAGAGLKVIEPTLNSVLLMMAVPESLKGTMSTDGQPLRRRSARAVGEK